MKQSASRLALGVLLALALAVTAAEPRNQDRGRTEPANVPLELKLVSRSDTYPLDLGGQSAAAFRKLLKDGSTTQQLPPPPGVDMEARLKNVGGEDLQVWVSGDQTEWSLEFAGQGVETVQAKKYFGDEPIPPKAVKLGPNERYTFPIKRLAHGYRGVAKQSYWLEAGEIRLWTSFKTAVFPAPKGSRAVADNFGAVTVTSPPIELTIEAK
jgi:hypothetical protein